MTIEEKAKEFAGDNRLSFQDIVTCSMDEWQKYEGFKAGAEWMLEKVMNLISEVSDISGRPVDAEEFRKALEE